MEGDRHISTFLGHQLGQGSALVIDVVLAPSNGSDGSAPEAPFSREKSTALFMLGRVAPE
jgi:hypothetical protein